MTQLRRNLSVLEKPYHTAGWQLHQQLISTQHPVKAFPCQPPEAGYRHSVTLLQPYDALSEAGCQTEQKLVDLFAFPWLIPKQKNSHKALQAIESQASACLWLTDFSSRIHVSGGPLT